MEDKVEGREKEKKEDLKKKIQVVMKIFIQKKKSCNDDKGKDGICYFVMKYGASFFYFEMVWGELGALFCVFV